MLNSNLPQVQSYMLTTSWHDITFSAPSGFLNSWMDPTEDTDGFIQGLRQLHINSICLKLTIVQMFRED